MPVEDKPLEELSKDEIVEALMTPVQPPVNTLEESAEELKAMGIPDISKAPAAEKEAMDQALKNIQLTKVLEDMQNPDNNASIKSFLEKHLKFLVSVSNGKTIGDLVQTLSLEHAKAAIKISLKVEPDDALIKKHIKSLRKKYN